MQSKKSCFNGPVFRKNLTRFAPAWILYTLCLILGMTLLYTDSMEISKEFWFAHRIAECIQTLGLVNLFWAPLSAMLIFGDLFNGRMCNALHAMPIRREVWFITDFVSGLAFSIIPTGIMTLASIPLLVQTCVENAWQIGLWFFLGSNLSFLCFFGMAVFSVFCTGSRLAMALIYALVNGGAFLAFWLVDTLYTPMLYGVVTPTVLVEFLSPIANILDDPFIEVQNYLDLKELYADNLDAMVATFALTDNWGYLVGAAGAGLVFALIGLLMYRCRDLECAGDMVAYKFMEPLFVVLFAVFAAAGTQFMVYLFLGSRGLNPLFLAVGVVVGWFTGHMLIARSTHVFRLKNWIGLFVLSALIAGSLAATHFDVLNVETRMPEPERIVSATLSRYYPGYDDVELTDPADIEQVLRLQEIALEGRLENPGTYPDDESVFYYEDQGYCYLDGTPYEGEFYYVSPLHLTYTLDNGKVITRYYHIRTTDEVRSIVNEYLSRWEVVSSNGWYGEEKLLDLSEIHYIHVFGHDIDKRFLTREDVEALITAIRADCEDRTLNQHEYFHDGHFWREAGTPEDDTTYTRSMYISISAANNTGLGIEFFPDSRHVLAWCQERNLLNGWNISQENVYRNSQTGEVIY